VPPLALVIELSACWNSSNSLSCAPGGMPGPVSRTATLNEPLAGATLIATSPASVNLIALPTRLSSTWVSLRSSPCPGGISGGISTLKLRFFFAASGSTALYTLWTTSRMEYSAIASLSWPASILEKSSTSLIRPSRCLPLLSTRLSTASAFSGVSP
jgi:hypothetical protein